MSTPQPSDLLAEGKEDPKPAAPLGKSAKAYMAPSTPTKAESAVVDDEKTHSRVGEARVLRERRAVTETIADHQRRSRRWLKLKNQVAPEGGEPSPLDSEEGNEEEEEESGCFTIVPESTWKTLWDVMIIVFVIYNAGEPATANHPPARIRLTLPTFRPSAFVQSRFRCILASAPSLSLGFMLSTGLSMASL